MDERVKDLPCGFLSFDRSGNITEVNKTFLDWTGYDEKNMIGNHFESLLTKGSKMIFHSYFFPSINLNGYVNELFINVSNQSGNSIPYLMNAKVALKNDTEIVECILVQMKKRIDYELELRSTKKQIEAAYNEKKIAFAKLEQIYLEIEKKQIELMNINSGLIEISNTDKLTGIGNRKYFQENLEEQIVLFHNEKKIFSLLIIDIDHFKRVNDTYGHQIGDSVLIKLAKILKAHTRSEDIVTRFGGEEFAIILPNIDAKEAKYMACELNKEVELADWSETGSLTISIGISTFTKRENEESIIKKADQALYTSKNNGRNQTTHFLDIK